MGTAALLVALALPPDPALADAANFRVPPFVARCGWKLADRHKLVRGDEVRAWNRPDIAALWERECDWRREVWDELDNVLYHPCPPARKAYALRRLRALLGDEDYYAGRLPAPIPTYVR